LDQLTLHGKRSDELKTMEEAHAVSDDRSHYKDLGNVWDREFQSDHFSRNQLTGNHCTKSSLCDLEAAAMDAEVSVLPKDLHNNW
jgi:hypothetical protein